MDTLLNRDLQLVLRTTTTSNQLKTLFRFLAENQGLASFAAKNPNSTRTDIFAFRTHGGTTVPLVFRTTSFIIGVIAIDGDQVHRKAIESARSFQVHYPGSRVIFAYTGEKSFTRDFKSFAIPYWWLV